MELLAAGKLLEIALGAIVGDAASEGAKLLWQKIKDRLLQNHQTVIEAEIVELEQNPTQEKLKQLESPLDDEMQNDRQFAEEISKLGREIARANSGDNITVGEIKAEGSAVAAGKIDAPNSRFGGSDTNINLGDLEKKY